MDGSMQSSPDPLNASQTLYSKPKARRTSRARSSLPLQGSSPKKQTFELDVGNELSPQKIRVTVEAGESDVYAEYNGGGDISPTPGPIPHRRERTTTTTVLVKGLSDSEGETQQVATPKRGRGRPKKSAGTPVPAKKKTGRSSTPTQKSGRRKSIGDLVDGDDEEDFNFEVGKSVEVTRGKRRSRSRSRKGGKQTPAATSQDTSITTTKKTRGRRKSIAPSEDLEVPEDESYSDHGQESESVEPTGSFGATDDYHQDSRYSTIRSTASIETADPDIVIARFDPGNETPRRTGWSSPRVIEAPQPSSSRRRSDNYPSPSLSPDEMNFDDTKRDERAVEDNQEDENDYADEAEDGIGELREFDTILESEGFSMISVDSVPSLREHLSSPAEQIQKSNNNPLLNNSLVAIQDADISAYNDSFSEIPDEILAAATPAKKPRNAKLLSVHNAATDDSLSSIMPEILEAATPAREHNSSRPLRNKFLGDLKSDTAQPSSNKRPSSVKSQRNNDYEDSFSAIPSAILDAVTPAAVRQERLLPNMLSMPPPSIASLHATNTSGSRLLTPDRSPSPPPESSARCGDDARASTSQAAAEDLSEGAGNESSLMHSHLPSSPPSIAPRRYTYTAHIRQHRQFFPDVTQTPSIVFSSPSLPPPIHAGKDQAMLAPAPEQSDRPALSPIARAGRMLQNIVVPSSPRSRSQSLGSPFKSPAADRRSSSIIAQPATQSPPHERRVGPLPKLDLSSHFSASSSQRHQQSSIRQHEDPFHSSASRQLRSHSPEGRQEYSLGLPRDQGYSDPRLTSLQSGNDTVYSDNDMSWQAEEEVSVPLQPVSTTEERWSAERADVIKQAGSAKAEQLIIIDSDDDHFDQEDVDDEGFGQLLETLNSSSPAMPKPQEVARDIVEKPRRSKIPSPWRKNSKRLVYSDELSQITSPPLASKVVVAKEVAREELAQPVTVRHAPTPDMSSDISADFSGWRIPQKANFNPRPREPINVELSALLSASPVKQLPVLPKSSQQPTVPKESNQNERPLDGLPAKRVEQSHERPIGFAPIPQKMGFKPRPRGDSTSAVKQLPLGQSLFNKVKEPSLTTPPVPSSSSPASMPLTASSPSRTNTLPACRTPSAQVSPLNSERDSSLVSTSGKENQITNSRTLKWTETLQLHTKQTLIQTPLPPPNLSPTKSCLRSPMKTPSGYAGNNENTSPSKAVAFVSSSPMAPSPTAAPLSSTTWSKDHWKLLDEILQQWKPANQNSEKRRRNNTRVISKLLGKTVSSQGEKLVLEQWHLEVVDEFRGYVPGWEEKVVAMRVFSLVVGEEKRALRAEAMTVRC